MTDQPTSEPHTEDSGASTAPPPPRPPRPPRPPLVRRSDDRMLGGVASGVAAWLDIDTTIVRIGFVVLGVLNGIGVVAYIAAWLLLPEDTDPVQTEGGRPREHGHINPDVRDRGPAFWIGIVLLGVVALMIADRGSFFPFGGLTFGPAVVLIAIGVALWQISQRNDGHRDDATAWMPPAGAPTEAPTGAPTGAPTDASAAWPTSTTDPETTRSETVSASPTGGSESWMYTPTRIERGRQAKRAARGNEDRRLDWTPPPAPPREPSYLGRVVMAIALIAAGVLASLSVGGELSITASGITATVVLILGLGLMVGSVFGRARWLALVALILLPFLVASSLASSLDIDMSAGVGGRDIYVGSEAADLLPSYELGLGELNLWLDRLEPGGTETLSTEVQVGAGELNVWYPVDHEIRVHATANVGEIRGPDFVDAGQGLERTFVIAATDAETGEPIEPLGVIDLDLSVAAGSVNLKPSYVVRTESTATTEEFTR